MFLKKLNDFGIILVNLSLRKAIYELHDFAVGKLMFLCNESNYQSSYHWSRLEIEKFDVSLGENNL